MPDSLRTPAMLLLLPARLPPRVDAAAAMRARVLPLCVMPAAPRRYEYALRER